MRIGVVVPLYNGSCSVLVVKVYSSCFKAYVRSFAGRRDMRFVARLKS
jgi:hypothetical protein